MSSRASALDHRWGPRQPLARVVDLHTVSGTVRGVVENVSISGAYLSTEAELAAFTPVSLGVPGSGETWKGFVARRDEGGLGIEWLEPQAGISERLLHANGPAAVRFVERSDHRTVAWQVQQQLPGRADEETLDR